MIHHICQTQTLFFNNMMLCPEQFFRHCYQHSSQIQKFSILKFYLTMVNTVLKVIQDRVREMLGFIRPNLSCVPIRYLSLYKTLACVCMSVMLISQPCYGHFGGLRYCWTRLSKGMLYSALLTISCTPSRNFTHFWLFHPFLSQF